MANEGYIIIFFMGGAYSYAEHDLLKKKVFRCRNEHIHGQILNFTLYIFDGNMIQYPNDFSCSLFLFSIMY